MKLIEITAIKVAPNRQRRYRSEQDHQDLFVSVSEGEAGLIHAPTLWVDGDEYWLVAGEGRLKVVREMNELGIPLRYEGLQIPAGMIPYTLVSELSTVGRFEAEFDENVRRTPLTVAERASATAHLFELKKMKAERDGTPPPTVADLSLDVRGRKDGDYQENTRRELIVARHLEDKDVREAKSIDEAFNVVKKKETQRQATRLAQELGSNVKAHGVEFVCADARDWLAGCPAERFSVVLSDPPYGMGAETFGEYDDAGGHNYDDSLEAWSDLMLNPQRGVLRHLGRVCKPDAHLYLFCDFDRFHALKAFLSVEGWTVHRTPLMWVNTTGFRTPWPEHGPQRKYELILYARRGEKRVMKVCPDVIVCARDGGGFHRAQKPVPLLADLLARSAFPTDEVLDFCSGSGSTGIACHQMNLACVCVEKDEAAHGMALKRMQGVPK